MSNFVVVELVDGNVIVHESFDDFDAAVAAVRNVKRRAAVSGEVVAAAAFDEEVIESNYAADGYITFAAAAELVGVRYQQVFQRAVVKGKMSWKQTPTNHVLLQDALEWKQKRDAASVTTARSDSSAWRDLFPGCFSCESDVAAARLLVLPHLLFCLYYTPNFDRKQRAICASFARKLPAKLLKLGVDFC
jgi:hypothetical protein